VEAAFNSSSAVSRNFKEKMMTTLQVGRSGPAAVASAVSAAAGVSRTVARVRSRLPRGMAGAMTRRQVTATQKKANIFPPHQLRQHRMLAHLAQQASSPHGIDDDTSSSDRFRVSVLTPSFPQLERAFDVVAEAFMDEPASIHLEPDRAKRLRGWTQFAGHFKEECSQNGMSVACVDQDDGDGSVNARVAATVLVRDFSSELPPLIRECIEHWSDPAFATASQCEYAFLGPLLEALVDVDNKYLATKPGGTIEPGTVLDLWMGGTDRNYRQRGLMTDCLRKAMELARDRGYSEAIAECTGAYSARAMHRIGASTAVAHAKYATFPLSDGTIGLRVNPPHDRLEILSFDLAHL